MVPKTSDEKDVYHVNATYIYRKYRRNGLLVDREKQKNPEGTDLAVFELNETGCYIVEQIKVGKRLGEIIKNLTKKFRISPLKAKKDTLEFINGLIEMKIIERQP